MVAELKQQGDSVGGVVSCVIHNVPAGLSEPSFGKLEAKFMDRPLEALRYPDVAIFE